MRPGRNALTRKRGEWSLASGLAQPEHEALVLASRRYLDSTAGARIAHLSQSNLDWPLLLRQAARHGTLPLLYFNLRSVGAIVPASVMEELAQAFRTSAHHNLYLLGELLTLIESLERHDIAVMSFKGPLLAVAAFGNVSLREFSDLDLLIRERDIARACEVLAQSGLHCTHHPRWIKAYLRFGHELDFVGQDGAPRIDLQWRFAKKWLAFPVDHEAIWARSTCVACSGRSVRQPAPEDMVLILCGHPFRHCWSHLKWVSDLSAFMFKFEAEIDWAQVLERARALGGMRVLGLGVWLAHELGGVRVPRAMEPVLLTDPQIDALGAQTIARLFVDTGPVDAHGSAGVLTNILFYLRARERVREKLPVIMPLLAHAGYLAQRYAHHYSRRLFVHRQWP